MKKSLTVSIKKEFEGIKSRYQAKYGAVIFDIKIKKTGDCVILEGLVLTERQKNEAQLAAQEILKKIKTKNEIKVLGDLKENLEIGWGVIKNSIVDIWAIFPEKNKLSDSTRSSQAVKNDVVRILAKKGNYFLVQTQDLATGWAEKRKIKNEKLKTKNKNLKLSWNKVNKAEKSGLFKIKLTDGIRKKTTSFLKNYLYAPYVLGGMTELGIDCSGLVQKFYWEIFRVLLPRHSADQAECGEKVSLEESRFGDLIFLRGETKKYPHIGIIIDKFKTLNTKRRSYNNILILNARREKGGVVIQSAKEILKDYNLISVKRLINIKK